MSRRASSWQSMSWQSGVKWLLTLVLIALPAIAEAAPRVKKTRAPRGKKVSEESVGADAKKIDLAQAKDDETVLAQFMTRGPGLAVLRLTSRADEPIIVQVPLIMGAVPAPPKGGNQATNLALFGTADPPSLVTVVSPQWAGVGVEKKRKKAAKPTTSKKKKKADADDTDADDDADKDADKDKKDGDKKDDAKDKKEDSSVANVPLPPGFTYDLQLIALSLDMKKGQPGIQSPYSMADLEKVAPNAPELPKVLEQVANGKLSDLGVAQVLVWRLNGRHSWEEMAESGLITPQQLSAAKQFSEGGAAAVGGNGGAKKKSRRSDDDE